MKFDKKKSIFFNVFLIVIAMIGLVLGLIKTTPHVGELKDYVLIAFSIIIITLNTIAIPWNNC